MRQVCSLFRIEVEEHFYKYHRFQFKTSQGLDLWRIEYPGYLSLMQKVTAQTKAIPSLHFAAQHFRNLKELTIYLRHYVSLYEPLPGLPYGMHDHWQYQARPRLGFLNPELLLAWHVPESIVNIFPRFQDGVIQHDLGTSMRFLVINLKMVKEGTWSSYLDSINSEHVLIPGKKRWADIDLRRMASNIDETIAQMRDGRCKLDWTTVGAESYKTFDDLVRTGLGHE